MKRFALARLVSCLNPCLPSLVLAAVMAAGLLTGVHESAASSKVPASHEDWKGPADPSQFSLGFMTGLGVLDNRAGLGIVAAPGLKIVDRGFVPDIDNQVYLEAEVGPLIISGDAGFLYGLHLRWDFTKDDRWTFYSLAGLGGVITGSKLGDRTEFYPRFGAGAHLRVDSMLGVRAEISHELITAGVMLYF